MDKKQLAEIYSKLDFYKDKREEEQYPKTRNTLIFTGASLGVGPLLGALSLCGISVGDFIGMDLGHLAVAGALTSICSFFKAYYNEERAFEEAVMEAGHCKNAIQIVAEKGLEQECETLKDIVTIAKKCYIADQVAKAPAYLDRLYANVQQEGGNPLISNEKERMIREYHAMVIVPDARSSFPVDQADKIYKKVECFVDKQLAKNPEETTEYLRDSVEAFIQNYTKEPEPIVLKPDDQTANINSTAVEATAQ